MFRHLLKLIFGHHRHHCGIVLLAVGLTLVAGSAMACGVAVGSFAAAPAVAYQSVGVQCGQQLAASYPASAPAVGDPAPLTWNVIGIPTYYRGYYVEGTGQPVPDQAVAQPAAVYQSSLGVSCAQSVAQPQAVYQAQLAIASPALVLPSYSFATPFVGSSVYGASFVGSPLFVDRFGVAHQRRFFDGRIRERQAARANARANRALSRR